MYLRPGALAGATRTAVLSRCVKLPQQPTALTNRLALSVVQDVAEWKHVFVFVHLPEDAQHTAAFFTTELLAVGELHRMLHGRAWLQHVFLVEAKHIANDDLTELLAVGIVRTTRGCTGGLAFGGGLLR